MRPLIISPLALLGACAMNAANPPVIAEPSHSCENAQLGRFVGLQATQQVGAEMLSESGARVLRWVAIGQMVTMDFRGDRLTVHLGPTNLITSAACG